MLTQKQLKNFLNKIDYDSAASCWLWTGAKAGRGYGVFRLNNPRRQDYVHRIAYREWIGEIPDNYIVHHRCETVCCVNPKHLVITTQAYHMRQHYNGGIGNFCSRGHDLSIEGSRFPAAGRKNGTVCLACARENTRRCRERLKKLLEPSLEL